MIIVVAIVGGVAHLGSLVLWIVINFAVSGRFALNDVIIHELLSNSGCDVEGTAHKDQVVVRREDE